MIVFLWSNEPIKITKFDQVTWRLPWNDQDDLAP
jgi:hypothetical protein